jgi:competence protein ComEC
LIGYRNDLDERISDAYSETGVVHVIAISGLHIGVIYSILSGLLNLLIRSRNMRWMATMFALTGIWGFGLLAGGGPSVMRSVCMFSIIGIGQQLTGREGQGLNTLAAVACLMLAVQPWWLWDLGFQLSFTAVAGLMICYQPILGILPIRNPVAQKVWEMTAVTLAAQILTTPLLLHTFGKFPVFFLITNMVAIPLSTLILLGELGLCMLAPLHHNMAEWCGTIVTSMIQWLNDYIFRMESIPFGTLEHIHVSMGEMMFIYLALGCIVGWRIIKTSGWLMAALISLTLTGTIHAWIKHNRMNQRVLVVMPLSRTRLLMLIEGTTARWLVTAFGQQDLRQMRMTMRAAGHYFGIDRHIIDTIPASRQLKVSWNELDMLLLSSRGTVDSAELYTADIIVLSGNGPPKVDHIMARTNRPLWIADGTNRLWKILQWETAAERLPLRLISTRRSGAFVHRIR